MFVDVFHCIAFPTSYLHVFCLPLSISAPVLFCFSMEITMKSCRFPWYPPAGSHQAEQQKLLFYALVQSLGMRRKRAQLAKTTYIYICLFWTKPPQLVAKHRKYKTKTVRVRNSKLGSASPAFCCFSFSKFGGKISQNNDLYFEGTF